MNRGNPSLNGGSLETTLTVPLNGQNFKRPSIKWEEGNSNSKELEKNVGRVDERKGSRSVWLERR